MFMFFFKNKVFQHVAEMLKLQTFRSNWTARACNFSKEISGQLWLSYYKKRLFSAIAIFTQELMAFQLKLSARVDYNEVFLRCTSSNMTLQMRTDFSNDTALVMILI